jgi:hypothetical protein
MWCKLLVHPTQVELRADLAEQMIRRHNFVKIKLEKKVALSTPLMSRHRAFPWLRPRGGEADLALVPQISGLVVPRREAPLEDYWLRQNKWQIELLANLDQVPPTGVLIIAS